MGHAKTLHIRIFEVGRCRWAIPHQLALTTTPRVLKFRGSFDRNPRDVRYRLKYPVGNPTLGLLRHVFIGGHTPRHLINSIKHTDGKK